MSTVMKTVEATEAQANFTALLDEVSNGHAQLIVRNAKPAAALVSPEQARWLRCLGEVLAEFHESLEMSENSDLIAEVETAHAEIALEKTVWYEV